MPAKHKNPNYKDRTAVAPYNFVPLPEKVLTVPSPAPQDRFEGYSGYFDCELETCTPLYVRGMLTPQEMAGGAEAKDKPEHFSLDGGRTPAIPGSTLRGLLRTLVEVVSYSKPGSVTKARQVYRSVGDTTRHGTKYRERIMQEDQKNVFTPKVQAGYMRFAEGDWYIQPAQRINDTTFARIPIDKIPPGLSSWDFGEKDHKNVSKIFIQPGRFEYQNVKEGFLQIKYARVLRASPQSGPGLVAAALTRSGRMFTKRSEAIVFPPDPALPKPNDWLLVDDDTLLDYRNQISPEQEQLLGPQGVLQDGRPVFYLVENDKLVFFGHTMMMRLPYRKSPYDLLPETMRDEKSLDLAEVLFGFTKSETAQAGRVFFSDAVCALDQKDLFHEVIHPKILGKPNPTTFQHYLEQPEPDDKSRLVDFDDDAALRGNKFYWHKGPIQLDKIVGDPNEVKRHPKQYTQIRPVRSGVRFNFQIQFENLTQQELGALCWILRIGARQDLCLKVGMAKPLGMGAVRVTANLHTMDVKHRYTWLFDETGDWASGEQPEAEMSQIRDKAEQAFVQWVLKDHEINPGSVHTLEELPRLKELLKLLAWPGLSPDLTRYMEIEHPDPKAKRGKSNEYRDRPVLPSPSGVGGRLLGPVAPKPKIAVQDRQERGPRPPQASPGREGIPPRQTPQQPRQVDRDSGAPESDEAKKFMEWFKKQDEEGDDK
jgi:CRISPR-associated protein (TIGR03986 family)